MPDLVEVEHLVIGAGVAGMTLAHRLGERAIVIDPHPDRYKIGESIIPQHFYDPAFAPLLERVRAAESACPKIGTLFVRGDTASYFPILDDDALAERTPAVHVERAELERISRQWFGTKPRPERALSVDFEARAVLTDSAHYRVHGLVADCSGPAMFVARQLEMVRELWPIRATWAYWDVERIDRPRFRDWLHGGPHEYLRYDGIARGLVRGRAADDWDPSHVTMLTAIEEGLWSWQIPLHAGMRLSFGLVSRKGPIDEQAYIAHTKSALGPQYVAKLRAFSHAGPYDVLHQRQRFARAATQFSGEGFALLGDAAFFGDPVYSVGTGVATSQALQLAELLDERPWSLETSRAWQRQQSRTLARVERAYRNWYEGDVTADDAIASEIQDRVLIGGAFRVKLADDYMSLWAVAEPGAPAPRASTELGADVLYLELLVSEERVLLLLEPDPDRSRKALTHGGGSALSHLDLELGPRARPVVLELARWFPTLAESDDPVEAISNRLDPSARLELLRRVPAGQKVPSFPLSLRSGKPAHGTPWPFDAESAALALGTRRAAYREARTESEALADERWLTSRGYLVERDGREVFAARAKSDLSQVKRAVKLGDFSERTEQLGALFGYPKCCIRAFARIRRRDDLTLFADLLPKHATPAPPHSLFVSSALALVSHAPCRANCAPTLELGRTLLDALESGSPGFSRAWLAFARRLHAIDVEGRCVAFTIAETTGDRLTVRDAVEIVAPSPGTSAPHVRPFAAPSILRVDRTRALLVADDGESFRSALFARHDG